MAQSYFSLVTTAGKIKLAESAAGGSAVVITHFAVGDGNGAETNPTAASTALVHEVWRTAVESVETDPDNPAAVLVTAIIPTNSGGWWMREFGIFADDGTMIAVAKPVSQYKPTAQEGQLEDIRYEFQIIIGENANVTLLVDPSLIFATREWVSTRKIPMAQMMRLPWLPVVSMTVTAPPAAPAQGDTYLVPAGATGVWAGNVGSIAEWTGSAWSYVAPPNGHGIGLPDGRLFERVGGAYVEKVAKDAQSGKWTYAEAGGTANALTAAIAPVPDALVAGMEVSLKVSAANTASAVTLNVNGFGTKTVYRPFEDALKPGDIGIGINTFRYDGVYWRLISPANVISGAPASGWTKLSNGLLMQWGTVTTSASNVVTVTFPVTFPTAVASLVITDTSAPVLVSQLSVFTAGSITTSSFQVVSTRDFSMADADVGNWIAIGY
ncbi:phage tail protein [Rhizobium cremeum]|uniref:phage tail-collar fiber domain-containing protein n=1 Tax=Rhizobium cremeum TaxID=2813827 RepID=UPI001FD1ABD7|nr:phage tail protein [Rhizobium cremeum]MCJ7996053.1 phage tail protein [Rhizobium cremeum]MCJ8001312.1 phage tail protein [Rhizobium cremeum]